jgi:hypothetical protein
MFPPVESQVIFLSKETPIVSVDLRTAEVSYTNQSKTAWKSEVEGVFVCKFRIYSTVFTSHIYFIILISMIASNPVEIRLPKTQSRKCLRKSNLWRYRAENVFGSLISAKLDHRGYQPTTCLNPRPRNFFLPWCLKCTLPFKPIISLTFC